MPGIYNFLFIFKSKTSGGELAALKISPGITDKELWTAACIIKKAKDKKAAPEVQKQ